MDFQEGYLAMLNRWFLHDDLLASLPIPFHYSVALVVLSYLVAAFGAYTSFQLIERVHAALTVRARRAWLVTAGFAMGCGIWAMHFIAMLAVQMPMHVGYDVWITIVSATCAVVASCAAFSLIADNFHRSHRLLLAGLILGAGIAAMHYIGMAAMDMQAHIYYEPWRFALSAVLAFVLSTAALFAIRSLSGRTDGRHRWARPIGAMVMGFAIVLMHYMGMFATSMYPESNHSAAGLSVDPPLLAGFIGVITLLILGLAVIAAFINENQTRARETIRLQGDRYATMLATTIDGFWVLDADGKFLDVNDSYSRMVGYSRAEILNLHIQDIEFTKSPEETARHIAKIMAAGFDRFEVRHRRKEGAVIDVEGSISFWRETGRFICFGRDITDRKRTEAELRASETRFRELFETTRDAIMTLEPSSGSFLSANVSTARLFGAKNKEEFVSRKPWEYSPERQPDGRASAEKAREMIAIAMDKGSHFFEWMHKRDDGVEFPADVLMTRVVNGEETCLYATVRDITERKRVDAVIRTMARRDSLTGLANRAVFVETLQLEIARAHRSGASFAVLYIDVDHFKDVNDVMGHPIGDLLLQQIAQRLNIIGRETDTVARFGGDEFAIIVADVHESSDAALVADKVLKAMGAPFSIEGIDVQSGASIGIAIHGPDAPDAETLLSHADVALYRAKAEGRGTFRFFTDAMDTEVRARVTLGADLREAISSGQLFLVYQPQVDLETSRVVGLEALVRWRHPKRGLIMPGEFIQIAEKTGLITMLGHWVLHEACRQTKEWLDGGLVVPLISVNVSALQFKTPLALEADIAKTLAETLLPPELLELELTESVYMEASQDHDDVLLRLHEAGVRVAIDDFGTGYSSLDYLSRFPASRVKIAQSFMPGLTANSKSAVIVRAAIGLAHELGMDVIVEGVETAEQLELVRAWGARKIQGYYFSKPLSVGDAASVLRAGKIIPKQTFVASALA
jgi:diguanylate cyclase (GGDEF)-like protein/PAS domain S-box-containing protein